MADPFACLAILPDSRINSLSPSFIFFEKNIVSPIYFYLIIFVIVSFFRALSITPLLITYHLQLITVFYILLRSLHNLVHVYTIYLLCLRVIALISLQALHLSASNQGMIYALVQRILLLQ